MITVLVALSFPSYIEGGKVWVNPRIKVLDSHYMLELLFYQKYTISMLSSTALYGLKSYTVQSCRSIQLHLW